jgi:hypothetical protein
MGSQSLFVDDDGWEPVGDEDEDLEEDARLGWDHSTETVGFPLPVAQSKLLTIQNPSTLHMSRVEERASAIPDHQPGGTSSYLEPTQKLSDVRGLALFPD